MIETPKILSIDMGLDEWKYFLRQRKTIVVRSTGYSEEHGYYVASGLENSRPGRVLNLFWIPSALVKKVLGATDAETDTSRMIFRDNKVVEIGSLDILNNLVEWPITLTSGDVLRMRAEAYRFEDDSLVFTVTEAVEPPVMRRIAWVPRKLVAEVGTPVEFDWGAPG
jgi:hypothetical protein